jgi:MFS family permease
LAVAPFAIAFSAMLLSIALWEQSTWKWSALRAGLAIAPGPLLVPITSLLAGGRLIARFGAATVVIAGLLCYTASIVWWATVPGLEPDMLSAIIGMVIMGVGVGLTLPTLMGAGASALPPSSFATGSAVINMIRQTGFAVGVAVFVAIVGSPVSSIEKLSAFRLAWWVMAVITLLGLIPTIVLMRPRPAPADASRTP